MIRYKCFSLEKKMWARVLYYIIQIFIINKINISLISCGIEVSVNKYLNGEIMNILENSYIVLLVFDKFGASQSEYFRHNLGIMSIVDHNYNEIQLIWFILDF